MCVCGGWGVGGGGCGGGGGGAPLVVQVVLKRCDDTSVIYES